MTCSMLSFTDCKKKNIRDYFFVLKWTAISFFLVHGYFFSQRLANEDYLHDFYKAGAVTESGRFMSGLTELMSPLLVGAIAVVLFSLSAYLVVDLLHIQSRVARVFVILLMTSFPTLATGFGYLFMVQIYSLALLFAIGAVYLTDKYKGGYFVGGLYLAASLGTYQAYIGVSIVLSCLVVVRDYFFQSEARLKKVGQLLAMGLIGIMLYFAVVKLLYPIIGLELGSYKGIDTMGSLAIRDLPHLLGRTYKNVLKFFLGRKFFHASILHVLANLVAGVFCLYYMGREVVSRKFEQSDMLCYLAVVLLPLGMNFTDFAASSSEATPLTVYALVFAYILPVGMSSWRSEEKKAGSFRGLLVGSLMVVLAGNILISSSYYLKIEETYHQSLLMANRLYYRIENTEGFALDMPIAVIASNDCPYVQGQRVYKELLEDTGIWQKYIGFNDLAGGRKSYATNRMVRFINNTMGVGVVGASPEDVERILASEEYREMGTYPAKDSLRIIDGILVINFEDAAVYGNE